MSLTAQSAARKDRRTAQNGPTLDHRHFAFIASVIAELSDDDGDERERVARLFASACTSTNPRFDRARFLSACRVQS